jgi:steroid delta-isomerase-like uncharacterized protein
MSAQNVATFRAAHQAFNRRDFAAVVAAMTDGVVYEDRARNVTFRGRAGFREFMTAWTTAFSNAQVTSPTYLDAGDTVIALFTGRGTNDGPFGPLPASGKELDLQFCELLRFNDSGQIVGGAVYYDQLTLLSQLGHASVAVST